MTPDSAPQQGTVPDLDLTKDVAELTADLLDVYSVSDSEGPMTDAIERALKGYAHLTVHRHGDTLVARTDLGRPERVVLAGHVDTVPLPRTAGARGTVPSEWDQIDGRKVLFGRGATDMKGGVAVQLALAARLTEPSRDITYVFYDHEEVSSDASGLGKLLEVAPDLVTDADFAVLLEPTDGRIEGGCNGTMRFWVHATGTAAHSGRAWMGENAIHKVGDLLRILEQYQPESVVVEGLEFREGLNAVQINGGVAGNVIPDSCNVHINYRFAPDKTLEEATERMHRIFDGYELDIVDASPAARPGLDAPLAKDLVSSVGVDPHPKYGWTDVARFSALGIPAVNFGPGDALLAHSDDEHVFASEVHACLDALERWLTA